MIRRIFTLLAITSLWASAAWAAPANIENNGAPHHVVDLVFIAEGYTVDEQDTFLADATQIYDGLMKSAPYNALRPLFSAHAIAVVSAESGSDHPATQVERDTAFDSTFDSNGISRLITANTGEIMARANAQMPSYDIAILVVNDAQYGGSGGAIPMVSLHPKAVAILRHELAHNLADLADEYEAPYPGYPPGDSEPNVTKQLDPVPWKSWVASDTPVPTAMAAATGPYSPIGAYEGARYQSKGIYRPAPSCLMRTLSAEFCPICAEAMILSVSGDSATIRGHQPAGSQIACVAGLCPMMSLTVTTQESVEVTWLLDGNAVAKGLEWTPPSTLVGAHVVVARSFDTSPLVRDDPASQLFESRQWQLTITGAPPPVDAAPADLFVPPIDTQPDAQEPTQPDAQEPTPPRRASAAGGCGASPWQSTPFGLLPLCLAAIVARRRRVL
ncbi:MAG: hypothetical protein KC502_03620 [Myxococcales bacterium]|nr:hypothetical protein [Myxococcales bacterium]